MSDKEMALALWSLYVVEYVSDIIRFPYVRD
jgi:hypothetical protein